MYVYAKFLSYSFSFNFAERKIDINVRKMFPWLPDAGT